MPSHKYRVGQPVSFTDRSLLVDKAGGDYAVVRLMPNDGAFDEPQYRVKSARETHERTARESELRGLDTTGRSPA
jgi:hypothetical protein